MRPGSPADVMPFAIMWRIRPAFRFAPIWFAIDALHKLQHALGLDPAATFQEFLDSDLAAAD